MTEKARTAPEWCTVTSHVLFGTHFELVPEYGSELWYVVDGRRRDRSLAGPFALKEAKRVAERLQIEQVEAVEGKRMKKAKAKTVKGEKVARAKK